MRFARLSARSRFSSSAFAGAEREAEGVGEQGQTVQSLAGREIQQQTGANVQDQHGSSAQETASC